VKIGSLALLLPSAEPGGMSAHLGPRASIFTVSVVDMMHPGSEKSPIDPAQVLPLGASHVHTGQERPSVKDE
jgi:hypothetical protein